MIILIIIVIFILVCIFLIYNFQEKIMFMPEALDRNLTGEFFIDDRISCKIEGENKDNIILYSHGNSGNISQIFGMDIFKSTYSVFLWDYPGFGNSKGKMSLSQYKKDILTVYDYIKFDLGYKNIIVYGYSFGTGLSAYLAMKRNQYVKVLILEAPYFDFNTLIRENVGILSLLSRWDIPTYKYLLHFDGKLYLLHGIKDKIIPICHSNVMGEPIKFDCDHLGMKLTNEWKKEMNMILSHYKC